ncbi:hypothetical protein [Actinomadura algeriensis]|uniref:FXSXX-COOH protein n=1 Tax=Actinomadura algeriensis TaxID=1679523 RepID=A0ABR9JUV7_9ACTN|nr:hypothetical protein [Actinomadura algeriensis]MBE1534353.1 FXSXX-COOH protein [Actinomadura algeriensis]
MNDPATMCPTEPIDLSGLTLGQLEDVPSSAIALALLDILDPARGDIAVAGFDAFTPAAPAS